jgi:hypothetical protein
MKEGDFLLWFSQSTTLTVVSYHRLYVAQYMCIAPIIKNKNNGADNAKLKSTENKK